MLKNKWKFYHFNLLYKQDLSAPVRALIMGGNENLTKCTKVLKSLATKIQLQFIIQNM